MRPRDTIAWIVVALLFIDLTFFSGASNFLASPQSRILNQVLVLGVDGRLPVVLALRGASDLRSPLLLPGRGLGRGRRDRGRHEPATGRQPRGARPAAHLCARPISSSGRSWRIRALRPRIDWLVIVATTVFVVAYLAPGADPVAVVVVGRRAVDPTAPPRRRGSDGRDRQRRRAVPRAAGRRSPSGCPGCAGGLDSVQRSGLARSAAFALLVTGSRGAWLGAAAGAVVLARPGLAHRAGSRSRAVLCTPRTRRRRAAVRSCSGHRCSLPTLVVERMLSGDAGRIELWSAAWSMFASSPIVGVGPGAWPSLRAFTPISDDNLAVLATSHNSILQVLAESGVIGALAAVWLVVSDRRGSPGERSSADAMGDARITRGGRRWRASAAAARPLRRRHAVPPARGRAAGPAPRRPTRARRRRRPTRERRRLAGPSGSAVADGRPSLLIGAAAPRPDRPRDGPSRGRQRRRSIGAMPGGALARVRRRGRAARPARRIDSGRRSRAAGSATMRAPPSALAAMDRAEPFTFATRPARRRSRPIPAPLWARADAAGPYDPTATVNLAAQRFATDLPRPLRATWRRRWSRSRRSCTPTARRALFDDATWAAAQVAAIAVHRRRRTR